MTTFSRRWLLIIVLLVANAATAAPEAPLTEQQRAMHVLNRLGYGPRPGDVDRVVAMGVDRYISQQLNPDSISESATLNKALAQRATVNLSYAELFRDYAEPVIKERRAEKTEKKDGEAVDKDKTQRHAERQVGREAMEARLMRALDNPRQLEEVMSEFWFDHFNVFIGKGLDRAWIAPYERDAIRPHALGKFRDLLGATAHSPAMLFYLDNWQSSVAGAPRRKGGGKEGGLNENYARELMELHTLGVDGGYTQQDVTELARILTGWSFDRQALRAGHGDGFRFDPRRHDSGEKILLGKSFRADGEREGERALDLLAEHPSTAHHIAFELAQFFVADEPPAALVDKLAKRFTATDGDIRAVLGTLFKSEEFWNAANIGTKFKSPYRYVISSLRAADVQPNDFRPVIGLLSQLGMPLYGCVTPDGYKNTQAAWLTPGALTARISFATGLGTGHMPLARANIKGREVDMDGDADQIPKGVNLPPPDLDRLLVTVSPQLSSATRSAVDKAPKPLRAGLVLGSPEFQRY